MTRNDIWLGERERSPAVRTPARSPNNLPMRRMQFSFLHVFDRKMVRRNNKTVWCRDCSMAAYRRGNLPDGYAVSPPRPGKRPLALENGDPEPAGEDARRVDEDAHHPVERTSLANHRSGCRCAGRASVRPGMVALQEGPALPEPDE